MDLHSSGAAVPQKAPKKHRSCEDELAKAAAIQSAQGISYGKLVRQFPQAGSAYTYAQKAINPHIGFMVGWSSLLDYLFLPMINVLLAKIYLTALFPGVARIFPA